MPEITIGSAQDLVKLTGWRIEKAEYVPELNGIRLILSHVAAEKRIMFTVFPGVSLIVSSLTVSAQPLLHMRAEDA